MIERRHDFIPRRDADFDVFFRNITMYVTQKTDGANPAWTHIAPADLTALSDSYASWYAIYTLTLSPHTPAQKNEKNRVRRIVERGLREFINMYLRHRPVTDYDRDNMGIPNPDLIRTPHVEVNEEVEFNLVIEGIRVVHVHFKVLGADNRAKPAGYDGAVIVWDVLDAPPADVHALTRHTMASRTPHTIEFIEEERGKTAYIALAWQNERGLTGRWSDIKSAVIP